MAATAPPNGSRGGYDYQFVKTPPDTLICTVCFLPSKEPNLSGCCGHTFCKSCVEGSKKFSNICPMCRSEEFVTMLNKQADRQIRSLHVFCTNKEQGCEWQGEVNDITNHLGNCPFQVVRCPNDCGEFMQRQYLFGHAESKCSRRRVSCQYCSDDGEHQFIEGKHKEVCPKFPVPCPNHCEVESIRRDEVDEHKENCPLEKIQCDYHMVGCKVEMARKEINKHKQEMMEQHLSLSINELLETKMQLNSTQNNFKLEVEKVNDLTQQLMRNNQEVEKTQGGLTQRIALTENHLSSTNKQLTIVEETIEGLKHQLSATQLEAKKTKDALTQQLVCAEKNLTASQQEAQRTKDQLLQKLTTTEKELNTTKQQLAVTCQNLTKAEKEHTTLAASTFKVLTEMEAKFQAKVTELEIKLQQKLTEELKTNQWFAFLNYRALQQDQVVPAVVKMSQFTKHKDTIWLSSRFHDSNNCTIRLEVCGDKVDTTYMSVALRADHNIYTAGSYTVKLLNQISNSEHHLQDIKTGMFSTCEAPRFISYEDLTKSTTCQYLKDDTLFFEIHRNC